MGTFIGMIQKKYNWRGGNYTLGMLLKSYQKILKSNDEVLKDQLKKLGNSELEHFIEENKNQDGSSSVQPFGIPKEFGSLQIGSYTFLNLSSKRLKSVEETEKVPFSPYEIIVHEMRHQYDLDMGNTKDRPTKASGLQGTSRDPLEIRAVINENRVRPKNQKRTSYGGRKIDFYKYNN
ncbi:hypothetical protein P1X15_30755 [Runella sp. MFBS21]|uniref:hypothetical protein n=1 Tax=Runella sp. MFBS21 TaxID=3034018 RepID=UPI0023FA1D69|nr:hypothetical protein [Runella sp. MFBS21]MDF7822036.1 hypothetical protein [Runella sp. MFBS21]